MTTLTFSELSPLLVEYLSRYGFGSNCKISLAGLAGSRRAYFRLDNASSACFIALISPVDDLDFGRFLRITQFYRMAHVPVPMVYCIDDAARQVLLEDLGNSRLFDVWGRDKVAGLKGYRKALDLLVDLQTRCQALHLECPDIRSRIFDQEQLLWETSYYKKQYLEGYRGFTPSETFTGIFYEIANRVNQHPKAIMHRDFQSQNLMVTLDSAVHVIDYQGSRLGSIYYDLASLLLDPYTQLEESEIESFLHYFHTKSLSPLQFKEFREHFLLAGLQRIMQALGAYCFLSREKGIASFAEHIKPGEARLQWLLNQCGRSDWQRILPET